MAHRKGNKLIKAGLLLILAAVLLFSYNIYDSLRAQKVAEQLFDAVSPQIDPDPVPADGRLQYSYSDTDPAIRPIGREYPDYIIAPGMEMPSVVIDDTDYIGVISIPSLKIVLPVAAEYSNAALRSSPCLYEGSVYTDDAVICAHNYKKHFGPMRRIKPGAEVVFTDMAGNVFRYQVTEIETLGGTAVEAMLTGDWDLTLFTCTLGGESRITVRCEKQ